MATDANQRAIDIPSLLDTRSYHVYRLRTEAHKSFPEIGELIGVTRGRAWQIYRASLQRIELKKRGGDVWPEFSLSLRAIHCIEKKFGRSDVQRREVKRALMSGKMRPGEPFGYGWETHREVCKWAEVTARDVPWLS